MCEDNFRIVLKFLPFSRLKFSNINMSNTTSNYNIKPLKVNAYSNDSSEFALQINFERNSEGITGILFQYHLICAILVIMASINFLFDAKDTNRSCLLAALLLVMTTIFSVGQVTMHMYC